MRVRTGVGTVELEVVHGQDPGDGHWGCPMRERWGLSSHQQLSPALEDKLCFTLTATGTYGQAAEVAAKWGSPIDDSTLHALAQRVGGRAERQTEVRVQGVPKESLPQKAPSELAVLMIDGWLARHRGEGWGRKKTQKARVEWHEMKTGVFYRQEQSSQSQSGRGLLAEKVVVSWQGEPMELGRRLHWEGLRGGLGRAHAVLAVGDGAPWIWRLVEDRFGGAAQLLDFYHASQHLWAIGRALHGEGQAAEWVEPRLHRLRHGQESRVLAELRGLKVPAGEAGQIVQREQNYFAGHAQRMNYQQTARRGWPIGSGAVESACRQRQCRFKRPGQFWTSRGLRHLIALEEARHNGHWEELWMSP
ncbi:MAG TPA: hypothetical protein VK657_02505 [Terriglobales bacterium]|nr:hypothetical protein [Terriglobales bacterium]